MNPKQMEIDQNKEKLDKQWQSNHWTSNKPKEKNRGNIDTNVQIEQAICFILQLSKKCPKQQFKQQQQTNTKTTKLTRRRTKNIQNHWKKKVLLFDQVGQRSSFWAFGEVPAHRYLSQLQSHVQGSSVGQPGWVKRARFKGRAMFSCRFVG